MSDPVEVSGGRYADPARWQQVARSTGYDVELLRELDAPSVVVAHRMMAVGWLRDGRAGMEGALHDFVAERRAAGADDAELAEWLERLERAKQPDATMAQSVLFRSNRRTEAQLVAERLLAASFAHASGGSYRDVAQAPIAGERVLEPSVLHAALNLDLETLRADGSFRPDVPFGDWSQHPPE